MSKFVSLDRRFHDLTAEELGDPEYLASLNEFRFESPVGWPELLESTRVVILAEAGSGKTREMEEQARSLAKRGSFAFFAAIERIAREGFCETLSRAEKEHFDTWLQTASARASFFLDAVDELKLTAGKLDDALRRFANAVGDQLHRARIVISCRPNDWRHTTDARAVEKRLGLATEPIPQASLEGADFFLAPLRRAEPPPEGRKKEKLKGSGTEGGLRVVAVLPMGGGQIRIFAEHQNLPEAAGFLTEISRQNAWIFARRPLDLIALIASWKTARRLGTRAEQHEANITLKLLDDPERADRDVLDDAKARIGAERLALALALTRTRTIQSPDQPLDGGRADAVLDPRTILKDWSEWERQTLLRRALFDPATYGRVRFHHRSVQEYLAAHRLKVLRARGMTVRALFRLIFAERYGTSVVLPSMRDIAAWFALWDDDVRRELMAREPEALLSSGDPGSLDIPVRAALLRRFAAAYGKGDRRGLSVPIDEVRRLAHPDLAPVIRDIWTEGHTNPDLKELLIETIWQGKMAACADLVEAVAVDTAAAAHHRIMAIRALLECDAQQAVSQIANKILTEPTAWPRKVIYSVADNLFPTAISVDQLIILVERTPEGRGVTDGFGWILLRIIEQIDAASADASYLRDHLADLIWRNKKIRERYEPVTSRRGYLAPALASLCARQIAVVSRAAEPALIRASIIASRFERRESLQHEPGDALRTALRKHGDTRAAAFWADLEMSDAMRPGDTARDRLFEVLHGDVIDHLDEQDRAWLELAVADARQPSRRPVALAALVMLWIARGAVEAAVEQLLGLVRGEPVLEGQLAEATRQLPIDPRQTRYERDRRRRKVIADGRARQELQRWSAWRATLLVDPDAAFAPEARAATLSSLLHWFQLERQLHQRTENWDEQIIARAFSPNIARRMADALYEDWRLAEQAPWSACALEERGVVDAARLRSLYGLMIEASRPGWATRLTSAEARRAAIAATSQFNGLAGFSRDLAVAHPHDVEEVIGDELDAQLARGSAESYLPLLQDLSYADPTVQRLLAPRIVGRLAAWPNDPDPDGAKRWSHNLEQALRIVDVCDRGDDRKAVADACAAGYASNPAGPLAREWLRGLLRADPVRGVDIWTAALASRVDVQDRAIADFAELFGHRRGVAVTLVDPAAQASILARLVRAAYAHVRHEDDQRHEGSYSPDTRDDAEHARSNLLSALLATPGPQAHREIIALSREPNFAHFADRLEMLARERAAKDAEFPAFAAEDVAALDSRNEAPPHDRDGLFQIMLDRLEDEAHDIAHHDFSDRRTLRTIRDEDEMQRTLARRLEARANGAYRIVREDEVADKKRTDIRLLAVRGEQKAVVEIKIADKRWSVSDFERALHNQLVGQYLRHEDCRAGCLLLTYGGAKRWWQHPASGASLDFASLVSYLRDQATTIEAAIGYFRLYVFGLDLTDPPLPQAHRNAPSVKSKK